MCCTPCRCMICQWDHSAWPGIFLLPNPTKLFPRGRINKSLRGRFVECSLPVGLKWSEFLGRSLIGVNAAEEEWPLGERLLRRARLIAGFPRRGALSSRMTARIAFGPFELDPERARSSAGRRAGADRAAGGGACWRRCRGAGPGGREGGPDGAGMAGGHRRGGQPHRADRGAAQGHGADAGRAGLDRDGAAAGLPAGGAGPRACGGDRGRAADAGRAAVPGAGRGGGRQLLRRRGGGGHHRGARALPVVHRALGLDLVPLPRPRRRPARGGARARRALPAPGQCPAVGRAAADHRRAGRRHEWRASLGRELRRRLRGGLRFPGPHHRQRGDGDRAGNPGGGAGARPAGAARQQSPPTTSTCRPAPAFLPNRPPRTQRPMRS